jgi:ABC-2 type transport system ATP-binding protein
MNDQKEWAIEIDGLTKKYGSTVTVDHISFKIPFGVIFAFLGPNGAGKTTTVEMLTCLRTASAGTAYVLGLDISKDEDEIRKRIGVLPQQFNTFPRLTVRENLHYYATMYENPRNIDELIAAVDLEDKARTQYQNLSGGLKRRVGVAIALVNDPQVIFLDEPTEGLDPQARRGVWEVLKRLRDEGKTIFLTTHYMEEAETLADIVAIILNGRIRAMDTTSNLVKNYSHQAKLIIHGAGKDAFGVLSGRWAGTIEDNGRVIVPLAQKNDLNKITALLDERHIQYEDLEMKKPTLEDVFLDLTKANQEATA